MTGALSFIGMLLVMAGVESNPGPDEKFVFRYLYLLIEVGTNMLRRVFDHIVGPDFKVYLDNNPSQKRDYYKLLSSRNKPTPVQLQLLPPIDNAPSSDKFDITLFTCLLRNACGLCPSSDQVWSNPKPTDKGVEVYITKLKQCRNALAHSVSVFEDETVLTKKWSDLCSILQGLSSYCRFGDLQAMIDKAKSIIIDDTIKETYEKIIEEWRLEIDDVRSEVNDLRSDLSTISTTVGNLEECTKRHSDEIATLSSKKRRLCDEDKKDIQTRLINTYQENNYSSLPLCPLLEHEKGDILRLYEIPTMYAVNYHKVENQQTDQSPDKLDKVKTCSDLFHVKGKNCKSIYLTGHAGVGKTSFCKFLSLSWCKSKLEEKLENINMQGYIDYLARFKFVFYVNLRDTHFTDVIAIVVNELFYSENNEQWNKTYSDVKEILENLDSLVIMDGLDEWIPESTGKRTHEIPVRPKSLKCVYLTTCRPYKIENVRLSPTDLDHQVQMTGLGKLEIESYVSKLINLINTKFDDNKNKKDFFTAVEQTNISDQLNIPMVTSHLVMLWFDRPLISMSKFLIYGNIMDMLFKLAHKKRIVIPISFSLELKLPDRLSELEHLQSNFSQIEQLCMLSFKLLFEHDTDITSLVFTRDQLAKEPYCLSEAVTNFFCTIGILSKTKVMRKFGPKECKLSFLHKSYLEFFAAIYVSSLDKEKVLELFNKCRTINDVLKYENFLIFYAGLSVENLVSLINEIYSLISTDLRLTRELSIVSIDNDSYDRKEQLDSLQSLILRCYNEGSCHVENSLPLEDFFFHDRFNDNPFDVETRCLCKLVVLNVKNVRLLWSDTGVYHDDFISITSLEVLHIYIRDSKYVNAFIELMKQNKSLQILSIDSLHFEILPEFPMLPLEDLKNLTTLSLRRVKMSHKYLQSIVKYLTNNVQLKHLKLDFVKCTEHLDSDTCHSLDLVQCNKLVYLYLLYNDIKCTNINISSLEYISVDARICYERGHVSIHGLNQWVDGNHLVDALISGIQHMPKIKEIHLDNLILRDNVGLLFHPDVKQVSITLVMVNMTARFFQTFIRSVVDKPCRIEFDLFRYKRKLDDGDTNRDMSEEYSLDHMYDYIKSISAIKVEAYWPGRLWFIINDNH